MHYMQITSALQHVNMRNAILQVGLKAMPLSRTSIARTWMKFLNKKIDEKKLNLAITKNVDFDNFSPDILPYAILENLIVAEMVASKMLHPLSDA